MPFAEIWTWVPLNLSTYQSDLRPSITPILRGNGGVYSGLVEEDGTTAYLIVVWQSASHHEAHTTDLKNLRNVLLTTTKSGSELKTDLVQFNNKITNALDAPRTEITLFKLKEGFSKKDLDPVLDAVVKNHHVANSKYGPMSWGPIQGKPGQFYLLFGWENSQAHRDTVADPSFSQFVVEFLKIVDFESCHADLSKQ